MISSEQHNPYSVVPVEQSIKTDKHQEVSEMAKDPKERELNDPIPARTRIFSLEFLVYFIIAFCGYCYVFHLALQRSEDYNESDEKHHELKQGWIPWRKFDASDSQYTTWRTFFPLIFVGLGIFAVVSNLVKNITHNSTSARISYYVIVNFIFIFFMHGYSSIFIISIALMNYFIAHKFGSSQIMPVLTWIANLLILWMSYWHNGFKFETIFENLGLDNYTSVAHYLDHHSGLLDWGVYFKVSMLRFISYNMDYHWMLLDRPVPSLKNRTAYFIAQEKHHPKSSYGLSNFLAYVFYVPLYIAGPIVSFNAFTAQVHNPQQTYSLKQLFTLLVRTLTVLLGFEIWLHYIYSYFFNESDIWKTFSGPEVAVTGYLVLNFMYTKFLLIWRFFRLAALFDGVEAPENMNRCVNNNYTFTGFWRSWHGSFNMWTVRYMYIPLGGKATQTYTIWIIFFFIGLWHELLMSWIAWALLNCVFFSLEILVMKFFYSHKMSWLRHKWYWRHIVGVAGSLNVFLLMIANLAILHGFEDSFLFIQKAFLSEDGLRTFVAATVWLFTGVMFMQEIRDSERRSNEIKKF
eukprot:TRINITY_DN3433_c0_g1_i1.p1 TRINITY_DN3433_c0_g1~~TRINITY_DN3433_c0_g1_i1.p1  ORF type:complete len:575 (+),score=83.20 TRINITY_DN3433_c0_g1_i1:1591-3315(+)